jgi:hypothetical protein
VVILAAELLKRANDLVRNKIHPTSIISGYRLAMKEVGEGGGGSSYWNKREVHSGPPGLLALGWPCVWCPAPACAALFFLSVLTLPPPLFA